VKENMWQIDENVFEILKEGPWRDEFDYSYNDAKRICEDANNCGLTPENMPVKDYIKNFQDAHDLNLIIWVPT